MPAQSKAQQRFMGMVHAAQKGDMENPSPEVEKAADSMSDKDAKDFASTSHKGLPDKIKELLVKEARGLKTIQNEYSDVVDLIQKHLEAYKKSKGTPAEKQHIQQLKTLGDRKKKLAAELDAKVSGLYKDAELKVDEMNGTGNVQGYGTPHAFGKPEDEKTKGKKQADLTGYSVVKESKESINELTYNEKQIKTGKPENIFYAFYKGKFAAQYWAMNSSDLFNMFWDEFKVRRPAGSQFKLNPEFIIVSKKEYDRNPNQYSKLKPYVDKFWDKLKNESVNESKEYKKGDKLKIKLKNGKKFDVVFDSYSRTKGVALGKFKDNYGEYDIKPFNLDTIIESVNENRWLALKQDESTAQAKIGRGISNINKQLAEMERFLNWYGKIKNESGVDNKSYWKRTNSHIYTIKERLLKLDQKIRQISE